MIELLLYTDGACTKDKFGGYAFALFKGDEKLFYSNKGCYPTTCNQMELMGALTGLSRCIELGETRPVVVMSDSRYVIDGMTKWVNGWSKRGFTLSTGAAVRNVELWVRLLELSKVLNPRWAWVKAHHEDEKNNYVDSLARMSSIESKRKFMNG